MAIRIRREPLPADLHVGHRLREQRVKAGMSQTQLGKKVGVTFQQIQKYENGKNRVSASRLEAIARVFGVQAAEFFENMPISEVKMAVGAEMVSSRTSPSIDAEAAELGMAFSRIAATEKRKKLIKLVEALADAAGD